MKRTVQTPANAEYDRVRRMASVHNGTPWERQAALHRKFKAVYDAEDGEGWSEIWPPDPDTSGEGWKACLDTEFQRYGTGIVPSKPFPVRSAKPVTPQLPPPLPMSAYVKQSTVMEQYAAAKARYPKHLLFFRIGDFYELFYEDAKVISRTLGLTLTSRNKGPNPIPMAGVPVHSAEPYVARLLRQGFSVAVVDPTEDKSTVKEPEPEPPAVPPAVTAENKATIDYTNAKSKEAAQIDGSTWLLSVLTCEPTDIKEVKAMAMTAGVPWSSVKVDRSKVETVQNLGKWYWKLVG